MNILEFFTQEGQIDLQSYVEYLFTLKDSEEAETYTIQTH